MRKLILFALAFVVACSTALAADVDLTKAQSAAKSFMSKQVANGRLKVSAANNLKLVKAETSVAKPTAVDYYIFNADKAYVVVAGDDQAPEILMYGEEGTIDINNIPPAMQWLLNKYKFQIDGLKAGTLKANNYSPKATTAVAPLTNANWDQGEPYWNHTPTSGSTHTYTGCPATSLSMCFYIYKWPKTYPALSRVQVSGGVTAPALSDKAADWGNMLDEYTGPTNYDYDNTQAEAVSWLMRYVGQACNMQYTTSGSGAYDPDILEACHTFGYTDAQLLTLTTGYAGYNQNYTDAQWNTWMLEELHAGRPIEYLASDPSAGGHAFNVFGCDSNGKYYVNWGWSGEDNGYCTLHNFTTGNNSTGQGGGSYTFNYGEAMIIGIAPPAGALGPNINVNPASIAFEGYVGETYTNTFTVTGNNLEGNITITKQGSNNITVSPTTITASNAANGVEVTVTYKPTAAGNSNATITLASTNAESVTVNVTGTAQAKVPTIKVDQTSLSMSANLSSTVTKTINVTGLFLTNNITVTLNDNNGVFSASPTTITASNAANGVPVTVSFNSANEGNFTGSIVFTSNGAETKTVALTARANNGGTASDAYLDIAKYATIGEAGTQTTGGWNSNYVNTLYKYTEYDEEAWLTLPIYGAWSSIYYDPKAQNWISTNVTNTSNKYAGVTWNASDKMLGSSTYFTSATARAMGYNSRNNTTQETVSFFVTNTTAVQMLGLGQSRASSTYPATLKVYECTENADGSVTAGPNAIKSYSNSATSGTFILSATDLDATKIYKVEAATYRSYIAEIGFKTELNAVGVPTITIVEPTSTTADVTWTSGENNISWNLRYREYVDNEENHHIWDFEDEGQFNEFTKLDVDGDMFNWQYFNNEGLTSGIMTANSGYGLVASASYDNDSQTALTPNNWLISPKVKLGGTLSFYACGQDKTYYSEKVGVYVFVGDTWTSVNDFVQVGSDQTTTSSMTKYEFDLSSYEGDGYVAIVHYNITDMFWLNIDDIEITPLEGEWIYVKDVESPYAITDLTPETTYEVQVQGVNDADKPSKWTQSTLFTTLGGATLAEIESKGVVGNTYTISDQLIAVDYRQVGENDVYLWCKDQGNASINSTTIDESTQIDFMRDATMTGSVQAGEWDQSNWVVLKLTGKVGLDKAAEAVSGADKQKHYIEAGSITGKYVNSNNYMIEVANNKFTVGGEADYTPNVYCTSNFIKANLGQPGAQTGQNSQYYFFMNPKIQEVCHITFAYWDGTKFTVPTNSGFEGEISILSWTYNAINGTPTTPQLENSIYQFDAVVALSEPSGAPMLKAEGSNGYVVYPTNMAGKSNIVTAINGIFNDGSRDVVGVEYVNSLGVVSKRPFSGINIVVTRYSDGSATTVKTVKKVFK